MKIRCAICGKEINAKTAKQKYCHLCSYEVNKKRTLQNSIKYREEKEKRAFSAADVAESNPAKPNNRKERPGKALTEDAREAKAQGMTYGQWQAMKYLKSLKEKKGKEPVEA